MNCLCLSVDRLHIGYLGAYGNAWVETPAIDRLASRALVFDQSLIDTPRLDLLYRSYWQGLHAMCEPARAVGRPSLPALLRGAGVHTALLTDDRAIAELPLAADFDELFAIEPPWRSSPATAIEDTHLARSFVELVEWLDDARSPFLLWLHLGSLGATWDAPLEFRRAYREPGDPDPPESAEVPDERLPADCDPDLLLGLSHAYAGQVSLFDSCLGALLESLESGPAARETAVVLASSRGFPLGEHGRIGACDSALHGELVHVPLVIRLPDERGAAMRTQALVEPADLWATLLDLWQIPRPATPSAMSLLPLTEGDARWPRDRLVLVGDSDRLTGAGNRRAIRSPAWYLRESPTPELYLKPDDRWEVNNVASRCQEVADCLQDALVEFEQTVQSGQIGDLPALSAVLREGLA